MPDAEYAVGVIGATGAGGYGHHLDKAFREHPRARVVAVADVDMGSARSKARELGADRAYDDWRAMLAGESLDIVVVAPRHATHHEELVVAAVSSGAHVYCEKPLARTLEEADRMVSAAARAGVKLACALPWRLEGRARIVGELVADASFGELREMTAECKSDARGGGEDFLILGLHFTDMMRQLAGDARSCWAQVAIDGRRLERGDAAEGGEGIGPIAGTDIRSHYDFEHGITGRVASLRASIMERPLQPYRMFIHGTKAIVSVRAPYADSSIWRYPEPVLRPDGPPWERIDGPVVGEYAEYHVPGARDLVESIEQDRPPACSGSDARAALEMILAAYASALAGEAVSLPLADRRHPLS